MSLAFPRPIPSVSYQEVDLRVERAVSQSRSANRLLNVVEFGDPLWVVDLATQWVHRSAFTEVEAWWGSLRGGLRTVLFRHPAWPAPRAHLTDPAPAQIVATVGSITSMNVVSLTGVDPALNLSPGDYISILKASVRHLAYAVSVAGSGSTRTIEIEPAFPAGSNFAGGTARFDRAELLMRPVAGSFSKQSEGATHQMATFQLVESAT